MEDGGLVGGGQSPRTLLLRRGILGLGLPDKLTRGGAALHLGIGSVALGGAGRAVHSGILAWLGWTTVGGSRNGGGRGGMRRARLKLPLLWGLAGG